MSTFAYYNEETIRKQYQKTNQTTKKAPTAKTITKADAAKLKEEGWLFDWSVPHSNGYEVYEVEASSKGEALEKIYYNPDEYLVDDDEK